ncbi:MAG: hypothetical protein ACI845_003056 [Gammaproteobacteria bacterium]|jgi:hypothetical protein
MNTKYFYLRRKKSSTQSAFVPVQLKAPLPNDIRLELNGLSLRLPASTPSQWVADLINQLRT